jgi:hypothetical protein
MLDEGSTVRECIRTIYVAALVISFTTLSSPTFTRAAEYHFCLLSDRGDANVTVIEDDSVTPHRAAKDAEHRYCEEQFGLVCAATSFDSTTCGASATESMDFTHAQPHVFHENPDGSPATRPDAVAGLTIAWDPDQAQAAEMMPTAIAQANQYLRIAQCPVHFAEMDRPKALPEAFASFQVTDAATLRTVAQYPGTLKIVSGISYCEDPNSIKTVDSSNQIAIVECSSNVYSSIILAQTRPEIAGILLLMGFARLSGIEEDVGSAKEYSASDPDLLLPKSKIVDGQPSAFHITQDQCVKLAKFALNQQALRGD